MVLMNVIMMLQKCTTMLLRCNGKTAELITDYDACFTKTTLQLVPPPPTPLWGKGGGGIYCIKEGDSIYEIAIVIVSITFEMTGGSKW